MIKRKTKDEKEKNKMGEILQQPFKLIGNLLGVKDKAPAPPPVPNVPDKPVVDSSDETGSEASIRQKRKLSQQALLAGRNATVLTSPLGLTEPAPTAKRVLLGR